MSSVATREVMEDRIRQMLELDRLSGDVQAQLRQSRERSIAMPAMAEDLQEELDEFESPEEHPDFVEMIGDEPLIEREGFAVDKYRSLRLRMGSSGPCCHRRHLHAMLDDVEDDEDLPLVLKGIRAAFNRHMRFSAGTADKVVRACARAGKPMEALAIVGPAACDTWRMPVTATVLDQLMLEVAVAGDLEGTDTLLDGRLAANRAEHRVTTRTLFYYARGAAEAGDIGRVVRSVKLARSRHGNVPDPVWAAAAPALAVLGADLAPESATAVVKQWQLFGLVAGRCAKAAEAADVDRRVFSVNAPIREAAREASPEAVAAASGKMPKAMVDAFDALSGSSAPERTSIVLEAAAKTAARAAAPEDEAEEDGADEASEVVADEPEAAEDATSDAEGADEATEPAAEDARA